MTDEPSLKPLHSASQLQTRSPSSMPSLTRQSADRMDAGRKAAKKILSAYPDYGKAPPEYVVNLAESLSYLNEEEMAVVMHPLNGVTARCKYLPTFADIAAALQDHKNKQEQFKPAHTQYKRLTDEKGPWDEETDYERKARVVQELLGYNPMERGVVASPRSFEPPSAEDMKNLKLKSPADGPSRELIDQLASDGWPFIPNKEKAA